ncbi:hypothetical protein C0J52_04732, partial [Blattella germanica]
SIITVQRNFRTRFHKDLPDPRTIRRLVTTICLCKGKSPGRPRVPQTPCDFHLWGYVKDSVFVPPLPANIIELRYRIINAIAAIDMDTLHVYGTNWTTGLMSAESQGEHTPSTYNYVKKLGEFLYLLVYLNIFYV